MRLRTRPDYAQPKYAEFRFDAGRLALNFVATLRHRGSLPRELLTDGEALRTWFPLSGLPPVPAPATAEEVQEARRLRESIHSVVVSRLEGKRPDRSAIETINRLAANPGSIPCLRLTSAPRVPRLAWSSPAPVLACLSSIARDAVLLIGGPDISRVNRCSHEACRMLFFDESRGRKRKWCSMEICGNREKVAAHRQRRRGVPA